MPYCADCGRFAEEGTEFCRQCGARIKAGTGKKHRLASDGHSYLCPNCGEPVDFSLTICPVCSYELQGAKSSAAVKEFTSKLSESSSEEQKASIIRYFPVPNAKEDILDFLFLASSNISGENHRQVLDAWSVKLEQCYQKALMLIHDRVILARIQTNYDQTRSLIAKQKRWQGLRSVQDMFLQSGSKAAGIGRLVSNCAGALAGLGLFLLAGGFRGGLAGLVQILGSYLLISSASSLYRRRASLLEYLVSVASGLITFSLAANLSSGLLQLTAVLVLFLSAKNYLKQYGRGKKK